MQQQWYRSWRINNKRRVYRRSLFCGDLFCCDYVWEMNCQTDKIALSGGGGGSALDSIAFAVFRGSPTKNGGFVAAMDSTRCVLKYGQQPFICPSTTQTATNQNKLNIFSNRNHPAFRPNRTNKITFWPALGLTAAAVTKK